MRPGWIVLLALCATPALASSIEPAPAQHWLLYSVKECADLVSLRIFAEREGPAAVVAARYVSGQLDGSNYFWLPGRDAAFSVSHSDAGEGLREEILHDSTGFGTGIHVRPGEKALVLLATFGAVTQALRELPDDDCEIELLGSGPTFATTGEDMEGGTWASAAVYGVHAHHAQERTLAFAVEHHLLGWFGFPTSVEYAAAETVTLSHQSGSVDDCPCRLMEYRGPEARGPGLYEVTLSGTGASARNDLPLIGWADVRFPAD